MHEQDRRQEFLGPEVHYIIFINLPKFAIIAIAGPGPCPIQVQSESVRESLRITKTWTRG